VKGVREPLRVHALQGTGELRTRFDLSRARGLSRFVGRTAECALLEEALGEAARGAAPIVAIVAEPGTGKSRLCFEFLNGCRERAVHVVDAHALAHARRLPFLPVRELIRQLFGIAADDAAQVGREKIAGRLLLLDPELRELLPLVFEFLGIASGETAPLPVDADVRQQRLIEMIRRVVVAVAAPMVLLWEDLHWLDEASEGFLRELVAALNETRRSCC
jgi:predicted ATPase